MFVLIHKKKACFKIESFDVLCVKWIVSVKWVSLGNMDLNHSMYDLIFDYCFGSFYFRRELFCHLDFS